MTNNNLLEFDEGGTKYPPPVWLHNITEEEQRQLYKQIKKSIPVYKKFGDTNKLEQALRDYETRNGIVDETL
ncbi:hypothetical protein UFOVP116_317 [uncultured Caudovirales phage]|uniref:Uncharacterized protein n=1 Tax=uncultured Caudovirales phage TaxID=2100421 RepID=A0A6J5L854_9CAUD|nr:hypothetical protein UFOVP116_317 [uncultured Caudovirales phage]